MYVYATIKVSTVAVGFFIVFGALIYMGTTWVRELVVKELANMFSFFSRNKAEVATVFRIYDFDSVFVVLVFMVGYKLSIKLRACEVTDSTAEVDTRYLGVVNVRV